jgi:hypothetical protein
MKIYKVQITYETVIRAASQKDAERDANYIIKNECDSAPTEIIADEISDVHELPCGWDEYCRPWGVTDPHDRALGEILEK